MRLVDSHQDEPFVTNGGGNGHHHHQRRPTHPFRESHQADAHSLPLVLRFIKGAIHGAILLPVVLHALFTILIVCLDKYVYTHLGLPPTIIPSLSIVVGLILVFRNQTSYNRFWDGRNALSSINTSIRNLSRSILIHSENEDKSPLTEAEKHDIIRTLRVLIAFPYAVKHYLRAEWGTKWGASGATPNFMHSADNGDGPGSAQQEFLSLLPTGFEGHEEDGLGLPLQLTFFVESFIKRGLERKWWPSSGAIQMGNLVNAMIDAYGTMETIKLTPIPIAHLIHQKQVLALFGCVLPFAMVDEMGWWAVPIVTLVIFTLYGIEGIGSQLEDPFGYDRNDIKMDAIVGDERVEIEAVLNEWLKINDSLLISSNGTENGNGVHRNGSLNGVASNGTGLREMFIRE